MQLSALLGTEAEIATQTFFVLDLLFECVCVRLCVRDRERSVTVSCDPKSVFSGYTLTGDFVPLVPLLTRHKTNCL